MNRRPCLGSGLTVVRGMGLDDTKLMRDEATLRGTPTRFLVHDQVTTGFGKDVLGAAERVLRDARRISLPLLLIHGDANLEAHGLLKLAAPLASSRVGDAVAANLQKLKEILER